MSNMRITVRRWTPDHDEPDVGIYELTPDGVWTRAGSESGAPACTLEEIMFVDPDGAIHVETDGTTPTPATLAAALPQSSEYLGYVDEIETGDEVLDQHLYTGLRQVAINGQRWDAFPLNSDQPDAVAWLECDIDDREFDRSVPLGQQIAWASGIENASMTSGTFSWSLLDVSGDYVCFVAKPDGESDTYVVEDRHGRTNSELARDFVTWVDWGPVAGAVARAIELGGEFDGDASELDEEWSDSCEVSAYVDLSGTSDHISSEE